MPLLVYVWCLVLFIADLLHPVHGLAVELFLNGNVCHGCGWCSTMPMLLTWREPDYVPWSNLLDRTAPALCKTATSRHD
ncbi:hypothetical protein PN499_26910 [Kamptonema animale CS-326]|uniref:hypothetical protein n=1 Tax=Kamptonema animale TaxID=92934 RepID=UPI00232E50C3|nr:hypothetical protein [Kamptonema animale]MDB9514838.1 hypothetical protein [Kamptonema animale CS-326]